ncbi:hypothetical protein J1605_014928 [Eschrichtius robustus]|uniref:Uncharacterized protein n=1 Tax=Eschrichtius robustus TaxID=9764 RepID=A0AB34GC88_ESCRO|nr:hypothetical protein J1605_014928 [Eschrichtius robustus]
MKVVSTSYSSILKILRFEFHLSYTDKERYENEERPEVQKQMLFDMAKKLPVYTRTGSGAVRFCDRCHLIKPDRCHHCSVCAM